MITNAESWQTAAADGGGDLNADGRVDRNDALAMYYVYTFGEVLKEAARGSSLRNAALKPRRGALEADDASYLQIDHERRTARRHPLTPGGPPSPPPQFVEIHVLRPAAGEQVVEEHRPAPRGRPAPGAREVLLRERHPRGHRVAEC